MRTKDAHDGHDATSWYCACYVATDASCARSTPSYDKTFSLYDLSPETPTFEPRPTFVIVFDVTAAGAGSSACNDGKERAWFNSSDGGLREPG